MKTTAYRTLLFFFITFLSLTPGKGQQYSDSLLRYLEIAAENNPGVQQKFAEYQAALQKVPQVGSLPDPELTAGVFLKPMELVGGNQVADLRLMQMFPWFGVLRNAKDEMNLMANAKFEIFRDSKLQVFYEVQRSWYELFKIRKKITISEKNIEILSSIERLALTKFKASPSGVAGSASSGSGISSLTTSGTSAGVSSGMQGMSGNAGTQGISGSSGSTSPMQTGSMGASSSNSGLTDLYRIQIETDELQNNIALLKNQEKYVTALFNSFLNRPATSAVFTDAFLVTDSLGMSLAAVSDSISSKNPMLSMLEFEKRSLSARKKMVTAMGYPMVGFGLNYSLISKGEMSTSPMNGKDMIMPMVSVTIPVYRKKYTAMQKEADHLSQAASMNYQAASNSLQTEYYQAVQFYQDAQLRTKLYENQFNLVSKSLELMLKSFSSSAAELTDVLRVQQQILDYELKQVEALADLNTAVAWLKRLMAFYQIQ